MTLVIWSKVGWGNKKKKEKKKKRKDILGL